MTITRTVAPSLVLSVALLAIGGDRDAVAQSANFGIQLDAAAAGNPVGVSASEYGTVPVAAHGSQAGGMLDLANERGFQSLVSASAAAGRGYLRAFALAQTFAYPDLGTSDPRAISVAMSSATMIYSDVTIGGVSGVTVGSQMYISASGVLAGSMSQVGLQAMQASDRVEGTATVTIAIENLTAGGAPAAIGGTLYYGFNRTTGAIEIIGAGAFDAWENGGGGLLALPFEATAGHTYRLSAFLWIESRVETDGGMDGTMISDFGHTVAFPVGTDVFDLPEGWSVDAPSAGIFGNRYIGVPAPAAASLLVLGGLAAVARRRP